MVDLHTRIREQPDEVLRAIANSMKARADEPEMVKICEAYLRDVGPQNVDRALEIGCGSGAATKRILQHLPISSLVGIDPSPGFIEMAEAEFAGDDRVTFHVGDAAATDEPDTSVDMVIAHTVFSHLTDPAAALAECYRVLRPGGRLVIFDGDYATLSFELFSGDPLQTAASVAIRNMIHAPYIMRHLPTMAGGAGFRVTSVTPYGYIKTSSADYLIGLITRSANAAVEAGEFGKEFADGLVREAQQRVESGCFYGSIMFVALMAEK